LQDKNLAVKQLQEQLEGVYTRDEVESIMHEVEADKQRLSEQNDLLLEKLEADNLKQNKIIQSMEKETQEKDGIIEKQKETNEKQSLENIELKDTIEKKDVLLDKQGVQINILSENLNKEMEGNKKYLQTIDQLKGDKKTLNDYNKLLHKDNSEQNDEISGLKLQLCNEKKKASIFDDTKFINTKISEFDTSKTFAEILNEVTNSNQIDLNNADNFKTDLSGNDLQSDECN